MGGVAGQTADGGNLSPGGGNIVKWCLNNLGACITVVIGIASVLAKIGYCSAEGETCVKNLNENQMTTTPTATPSPNTGTNNCPPPYAQCSSTPSANSTNKATSTPASTPTLAPPIIPAPPLNQRFEIPE